MKPSGICPSFLLNQHTTRRHLPEDCVRIHSSDNLSLYIKYYTVSSCSEAQNQMSLPAFSIYLFI